MVLTTSMLLDKFSDYQDPFGKIKRLCNEGKLYPVIRGIYETDRNLDGKLLSSVIYGPSYLSFNYALSHYGLIPEGVREYTSATCGKGKKKQYHNHFGDYYYRDIPTAAFPFETNLVVENGYTYSIATAEKALCDKLYELPPMRNHTELRSLLFDNLRIDEEGLFNLNIATIAALSGLYHSNNVNFLASYLRRSS